jgi:S1-C subfamily serine protease
VSIVDWVLIGALVVFALAGWFRGFVAGLLSFIGFLGGGLAAAFVLPGILDSFIETEWLLIAAVAFGVLITALIGQFAASILGRRLRDGMTWQPVRLIDNIAGAALNVFAFAAVVWIIASALAYLPVGPVSEQVTQSRVLVALDSVVPVQARNAFSSLRSIVGQTSVPRVFSGLAQITGPDVSAPDPATITRKIDDARESVVQVSGETPECASGVTGSGFVVDAGIVMTNAHVVAGVDTPQVRVRQGDRPERATVVYFDPSTDIALLAVPGLSSPPLRLAAAPAGSGDPAVVAGFPSSGPYRTEPVRIRTTVRAVGDDIYGQAGVEREVYAFRGVVLPGNSGGPLLAPNGRVLGLVFGADEEAESTGYALTVNELQEALEAPQSRRVDTGSCRIRD